jgi:hypothetical protein
MFTIAVISVEIKIPGEKLAIKIWESLDKSAGGLLQPWQIKRVGRALTEVRAERLLVYAQARKDVEDIRAGRKILALNDSGKLVPVPPSDAPRIALSPEFSMEPRGVIGSEASEVVTKAVLNSAEREIQRNLNLQQIASYAEEQGQQISDDEVSDEPIDVDWINKWRENAQDITDEYMQRLWGRILAEEAKSPGSYRVRTLDFLRTLAKQDAKKIEAIGPFVIDLSWIHRQDETFVEGKGPTYDDLLELQDMGIVAGAELRRLERRFSSASKTKFANTHSCGGKAISMERASAEPPYQLYYYRMTALGREVLRLGEYVCNEEYLKRLGLELKRQGFRVLYGTWIRKPGADSTWGRLGPDAIEL